MDDIGKSRRIQAEFILGQVRLARTYLAIAENPAAYPVIAVRSLKNAARVLDNINRFLAQADVDPERKGAILAARDELQERLAKFDRLRTRPSAAIDLHEHGLYFVASRALHKATLAVIETQGDMKQAYRARPAMRADSPRRVRQPEDGLCAAAAVLVLAASA